MRKVFIVCPDRAYIRMFVELGYYCVTNKEEADLICFTGGEDVSPFLYNELPHPHTYAYAQRDEEEKVIYEWAISNDIPCVGICRGGQFLNVMNGGKMFQHVSKHTWAHDITVMDEECPVNVFYASSTHHQMMRPGPASDVLGVAFQDGFKEHVNEEGKVVRVEEDVDTEIVFYPNTKSLCFQPHPEHNDSYYNDMRQVFAWMINKYLF